MKRKIDLKNELTSNLKSMVSKATTKIFWSGRFDESWWLEYMEGEFDPSYARDLEQLLKNSPADRRRLRQLERTRRLVKDADEVALPEDARAYDQLHQRIMTAVEKSGDASLESESRVSHESEEVWL